MVDMSELVHGTSRIFLLLHKRLVVLLVYVGRGVSMAGNGGGGAAVARAVRSTGGAISDPSYRSAIASMTGFWSILRGHFCDRGTLGIAGKIKGIRRWPEKLFRQRLRAF